MFYMTWCSNWHLPRQYSFLSLPYWILKCFHYLSVVDPLHLLGAKTDKTIGTWTFSCMQKFKKIPCIKGRGKQKENDFAHLMTMNAWSTANEIQIKSHSGLLWRWLSNQSGFVFSYLAIGGRGLVLFSVAQFRPRDTLWAQVRAIGLDVFTPAMNHIHIPSSWCALPPSLSFL